MNRPVLHRQHMAEATQDPEMLSTINDSEDTPAQVADCSIAIGVFVLVLGLIATVLP